MTEEKDCMRVISYASMVGNLMYVTLCTRPDICFAQAYTQVSSKNEGLYASVSLR